MALSVRRYKKTECITFKSTKGKYGGLSNMAPNFHIYLDGCLIKTTEALYQALRFPKNPEIQKEIINFPSPIAAKRFGRTKLDKSRKDWNKHRFKIMKFCIELKLLQNKDSFSEVLLATNNLPIVEYTEKDKVWGAIDEGDFYVGTNALGRLLMELRESLNNNSFELTIPDVKDFTFLGKAITFELIRRKPEEEPGKLNL
ncbi:hypothetical protein ASE21_19505 [Flavobacterium sp. Root901]|uniref:NADAR family protein n=1 Tax=Flavobacterium sp. Root901 TaxID=1736605 RepID=UPI0007090DF2|nr:NADAR family protein [Flavobacterium sp. Root901]KRD06356.1 hypothetical protein ASE21_19505 [Flavobacterium sp. Root901]